MKKLLIGMGLSSLLFHAAFASTQIKPHVKIVAPKACIKSTFIKGGGSQWYRSMVLRLTNTCGEPVSFQNATVKFLNKVPMNTSFWGPYTPLTNMDNLQTITTAEKEGANFVATLHMHFQEYSGSVSTLGNGQSMNINYGAEGDDAHVGDATFYTNDDANTGAIAFTNGTSKPANVDQNYVLVHLTYNGKAYDDIQLPWNGMQTLDKLELGMYTATADSVSDRAGNTYQATVSPNSVAVAANQVSKINISYKMVPNAGKISLQVSPLPIQLINYTNKPTVILKQSSGSSSVSQSVNWNATTTVSQLVDGTSYALSANAISYNGYDCEPTFNPSTLVASASVVPVSKLSYSCSSISQNNVTLNVNGGPQSLNALKVVLTPNNGTAAVTQNVALNNGSGTSIVKLNNNVIYTVSSDAVSGYTISYNPQPLTSTPQAIETITLSSSGGGTPIAVNGQLKVCGTQLCNKNNQPIQLRGMSSHGLQWYGLNKCLTQKSLDALANNFKASIMRLSMYVQEGGYETNPTAFTNQMNTLINEVTKRGMYVIVDWHMLDPGDPMYNLARAKTFFTAVATANKGKTNLIYEIANEPNGVSWATIKSYAEQIIPVIRAIDPNAVIIVGTRAWSSLGISDGSNAQEIIRNPVNASNIMYTFHFYAASHKDDYLNQLKTAANSLPIFVTEWGSQDYTGGNANDFVMSDKYLSFFSQKKISWTNWNYSDDFLSGAIWNQGTCGRDSWSDSNLKPSGVYVKAKIVSG